MARLRRLTALFACVLLLELLLVGSGYACGPMAPAGDDVARTATGAPAGSESGPDERGDCAGEMAGPAAPDEPSVPDHAPCPLPWAAAGCHGVPCAPAAVISSGAALASARPHGADRPSLGLLPPAAVARAPELPPPRA